MRRDGMKEKNEDHVNMDLLNQKLKIKSSWQWRRLVLTTFFLKTETIFILNVPYIFNWVVILKCIPYYTQKVIREKCKECDLVAKAIKNQFHWLPLPFIPYIRLALYPVYVQCPTSW